MKNLYKILANLNFRVQTILLFSRENPAQPIETQWNQLQYANNQSDCFIWDAPERTSNSTEFYNFHLRVLPEGESDAKITSSSTV